MLETPRPFSMRLAMIGVAAWTLATVGCTVCQNARRTVLTEPRMFSWKFDRNRSLRTYRAWAQEAWGGYCDRSAAAPDGDFAAGFIDGFVDFCYAGGDGEPPPTPPREFWNIGHRSPEGHVRANAWFAGYRVGAATARDGGYREQATVHSSLRSGAAWDGVLADDSIGVPQLAPEPVPSRMLDEKGPQLAPPTEPTVPSRESKPLESLDEKLQDAPLPPLPMPPSPAEPQTPAVDAAARSESSGREDGKRPAAPPAQNRTGGQRDDAPTPQSPAVPGVFPPGGSQAVKSGGLDEGTEPKSQSDEPAEFDMLPEVEESEDPFAEGVTEEDAFGADESEATASDDDASAADRSSQEDPFDDLFGAPLLDDSSTPKKDAGPLEDKGAAFRLQRPAAPAVPSNLTVVPAGAPTPPSTPGAARNDARIGAASFLHAIEATAPAAPEPKSADAALRLAR